MQVSVSQKYHLIAYKHVEVLLCKFDKECFAYSKLTKLIMIAFFVLQPQMLTTFALRVPNVMLFAFIYHINMDRLSTTRDLSYGTSCNF